MDKTIKISLIVALFLGLLTYAVINRYEIYSQDKGFAYKLDRWTGETTILYQGKESKIRKMGYFGE